MNIAERVQELRARQKISQAVLAEKSGLSQTYISDIEKKGKQPTYDSMLKLCSGFGMSLIEFLGGEDEVKYLPTHLHDLVINARSLSPGQVEILNQFIRSITEGSATNEKPKLPIVAEVKGAYGKAAANRGEASPMDDLPPDAWESVKRVKQEYLDEES